MVVDRKYGIKYEKRPTKPPLMVFWDESNARTRATAYNKDTLNGGTVSFPIIASI
jgi:hypothetical protein